MTSELATEGALAGTLVADFSRVLAGPYLTMLLGDLGATIVKVEGPGGDTTRQWGPPWHAETSTYYAAVNRNKRALVLDLADAADRELARRLVTRADVLVENLIPGGMAKFGLGYADAAALNPRLVYCSISGFGSQPGGAALPGYDLLAQALSGLMSITGPPGAPPHKVGVALIDILCGLHGAIAVLAALSARARIGRGQHVEVDLMTSALSALTNQAAGYLMASVVPQAMGNAHPSVAPYETLTVADGEIAVAVGSDRQFCELCAAFDRAELAADARFATNTARVAHLTELRAELQGMLGALPRDAIVERLRPRGVPCGPVNDIAEAFAFAERIGLDPIWRIGDADHVRAPMRMSATPPRPSGPPPALGEHGAELRAWLQGDLP